MAALFSSRTRIRTWRGIWIALAEAQQELGMGGVTAEQVADAAVDAIKKRKATVVPGTLNRVTASLSYALPHALTRRIAGSLVRHS